MEIDDTKPTPDPKPSDAGNYAPGGGPADRGGERPPRRRSPREGERSGGSGGRERSGGGRREDGPRSGGERGERRSGPGGDRRREGRSGGGDRPDGRRPRGGDMPAPAPAPAPVEANDAPASSGGALADLGGHFLASVSRSFSLTIRLLPDPLREPITLGYLLARALDTVADTPGVPYGTRLEHLRALLDMIKYGADPEILRPLQRDLAPKQTHDGERRLLKELDRLLSWLEAQPVEDRWELRRTLARIGRGQELDLLRFHEGTAAAPVPLATADDLDEYTYFVAGCVGELWTTLCQRHLPAGWSKLDQAEMLALGKRYGQGLQMVNIMRDLPEDMSNGRCYLPADALAAHGLTVTDLLDNPQQARPLLAELRQTALGHLDAAWQYVQALKGSKLRYACALPLLLGLETLGLLARTSPLETSERLKVSRASVKALMASAAVGAAFGPWLGRLHRKVRGRAGRP